MSVFLLKLIASFSMLTDHTAIALVKSGLIETTVYVTLMRAIGRLAFPIYCFLLVNGFEKTSDRKKYFTRLCLFAVLSQLPFSLLAGSADPAAINRGMELLFSWKTVAPLLLPLGIYWFTVLKGTADRSFCLLALAFLVSGIELRHNGRILLSAAPLNVFYTLAFSLAVLYAADKLTDKGKTKTRDKLLLLLALALTFLFLQRRADYNCWGPLLVLSLFLAGKRKSRLLQCAFILLWAFLKYGFSGTGLLYGIGTAASCVPICCYNGRTGRKINAFFYLFYPVHLLVLFLLFIR